MWDFILLLLFGSPIALSPNGIHLAPECTDIIPKKALLVRGGGAALIVELPYVANDHWPEDVVSRMERIAKEYPSGRVTARLLETSGSTIEISKNRGGAAKDSFQLSIAPDGGYETGRQFVKVSICASPAIDNAQIYWRQIGE
jgi:hypothetical protein